MSIWVGSGCTGRVAPAVTTAALLSAYTSMESGIEAGVLPTVTGSLASAGDSLGSLSRAAEPTYDTDHTDLGSELDEAEIRRELMHDKWRLLFDRFDPEGFGEIPWPDFIKTLEHPDFMAQVSTHKREILLDKAQSSTSDAITFQEFVNVYWTDLKHKTKNKISKRRQDAMGTGGGPPLVSDLNDMEAKIMEIIGEGAVFGDQQYRVSIFPTTSQNIGEVQEDLVVIENEEFPIASPSTRGTTTDSFVASAHVNNALTGSYSALPPSPQGITQSPIRRPQTTGRRLERTRRTRPQPAQRTEWIVELERRRVEAEEKLACAAMITAEAARVQSQAALLQAEACKAQAEACKAQAEYTLELINAIKDNYKK